LIKYQRYIIRKIMADILVASVGIKSELKKGVFFALGKAYNAFIYGEKKTFNWIDENDNAIIAIGYFCSLNRDNMDDSLADILSSFSESNVPEIKKDYYGQFIFFIKKGTQAFIFSDFLSSRNIFYSIDIKCVSSSFSTIEDLLNVSGNDLNIDKVFEYVSMRPFYPALLGNETFNKRIKWLMPYEYIKIDLETGLLEVKSIGLSIDNKKTSNIDMLSEKLILLLKSMIKKKRLIDSRVGINITGGKDSRLVGSVALEYNTNGRFRIAVSEGNSDSMKDLMVAKRLAKIERVSLDVYLFKEGADDEVYFELTEGLSPIYNKTITPLIIAASKYDLGLGGVYGSELFEYLPYMKKEEFYESRIIYSKRVVKASETFWQELSDKFYEQISLIKQRYNLADYNETDYIRIFYLLNTARYSSFIMAAYNKFGYQFEPFGAFPLFELALQTDPKLIKNSALQIEAISKANRRMAKIISFKSFKPLVPLSIDSFPNYLMGLIAHCGYSFGSRIKRHSNTLYKISLPGGFYVSNGWEDNLLKRLKHRYGIDVPKTVV